MYCVPIVRCDSPCRMLWADIPLAAGENVSNDLLLAVGFLWVLRLSKDGEKVAGCTTNTANNYSEQQSFPSQTISDVSMNDVIARPQWV